VFYGRDEKKPILVDGQLVVYAFDETGRDPADNRPTRRYVFPVDQVPRHMSISEVGASYSFWLPWDEAGGPRTEVSLICRFEPKGGAVITSEQTRHLLPGALAPHSTTAVARQPPPLPEGVPSRPAQPTLESLRNHRPPDGGAQLASYETPVDSQAPAAQTKVETTLLVPERRMSVTSIRLPDNFNFGAAAAHAGPISAPAPSQPQPPISHPQPTTPKAQPVITSPNVGAAPVRPGAVAWQTVPGTQPTTASGFGTLQLARPQIVTPQWLTLQPASSAPGRTTTVSQPATLPQPAAR
jgi:hypothetical protein